MLKLIFSRPLRALTKYTVVNLVFFLKAKEQFIILKYGL